ncbi:MAG: PTS fructose transporter subunit IIA [Rubrivivax sp.]|nr:PTS fructose transporter subunit IIA [Rubrivivax sp.]
MAAILLVAHAPLAASLLAVAQHVYPDCSVGLAGTDIAAGASPAEAQAQIRAALDELGAVEVLILTDVFGASPCKAALAVADGVRTRVVAGVNVPMLWRALCYASVPLDELVTRAVDGGVQGVMQVGVPRPQNQGSQPAIDDQVQHHHQQ